MGLGEVVTHPLTPSQTPNSSAASSDLFQSLAERAHHRNLYTTSRSGASESSSDIQQLRQERDHLNVLGRILETETLACQSAVHSHEAQVAKHSSIERND